MGSKVISSAIEFWKIFAEKKHNGENVKIEIEEGAVGIINVGSGSITVGELTFNTARSITRAGDILTKPLKRGELELIEFSDSAGSSVTLANENSDCFAAPVELSDVPREIDGNIIEFNKRSKSGTISFVENFKEIVLKFHLSRPSIVMDTIDSMKQIKCRVTCYEEYILGPSGEKNITGLVVLKIQL